MSDIENADREREKEPGFGWLTDELPTDPWYVDTGRDQEAQR